MALLRCNIHRYLYQVWINRILMDIYCLKKKSVKLELQRKASRIVQKGTRV